MGDVCSDSPAWFESRSLDILASGPVEGMVISHPQTSLPPPVLVLNSGTYWCVLQRVDTVHNTAQNTFFAARKPDVCMSKFAA